MASEHYLTLKMKKSSYNRLMKQEEYEDEEEEALSLCDLPTIDDLHNPPKKESPKSTESLEEFNFCFSGRDTLFNESELCAADDVFFQGQILPMRHSVSSIKSNSNQIKSNSRSESIDHCSSGGFTSGSSRSSSISSRYSSSSVNSTSKIRVINQFQFSHPSPKPQVKPITSNSTKNCNLSNSNSKSQLWSLFRVGLVTTPEIAIQDLKFRNNSNRSSRNSNNNNKSEMKKMKKSKMLFNGEKLVLFGGCKCSASTIESTIDSRIAVLKRNQISKDENIQQRAGKQALLRHRTFEWLKQLSLETATHEL